MLIKTIWLSLTDGLEYIFYRSDSTYIWSWRRWTSRHRRTTCLLFAWTHTGFHLSAAGVLLLPPLSTQEGPHTTISFSWLNLWCLLFNERRIGASRSDWRIQFEVKLRKSLKKFALLKIDDCKLKENFRGGMTMSNSKQIIGSINR